MGRMIRSHPSGWTDFMALRRVPETQPKRHRSWRHGAYSKDSSKATHKARLLIARVRLGVPLPSVEAAIERRPLSERWGRP
jgi:hypothetical protein